MTSLVVGFVVALLATLLIVKSSGRHGRLSADHDLSGPQKFHARPVPRIGGVGIFVALVAGTVLAHATPQANAAWLWTLLACSLPAFLSGLAEDLTKNVSPRRRLAFTAGAAVLGVWWLDALIRRTGVPGLEQAVQFLPVAVLLTVFLVSGVANAVNIIDGFNGLASMCVVIMLVGLAYVAFQVGDTAIVNASLLLIGAVLGFFVWNFPAGLIFLGDGGAYLLGFLFGELCVLLVARNPEVSPWFPVLLCGYPIFETVFSIYRKKFLRGMSPGIPDGVHLHMLVYKRLMRWTLGSSARQKTARNSMTSPYLWLLCLLSVVPAVLAWQSTAWLIAFCGLFILAYVLLYWSIVRFKAPKWLVVRR
ncbi:glycosyltransferase [Piscinibacter sakaiensis]|uniref:Undecaprenyl-phosphate N-acetylglucosaminyl 1-phosphate transferase n=1 Tax=Piscinibacter sakaiensis TaxID=1547922 RepID=A0A0K8NV88_PISS1|nr:glycosyltransferase [Piscinibacter sakaiensis]GAP33860.1 undecaprenyl-phosphate N-acetylglucosaminyl 1-phosphate transferase [Piscinibacter sakaiensis]